ncbi:threonine--tRNA ligase [Candidatus Falkowbacteria bacterium]|nr:threonine--tRNA ligase [Candidatus Falkowbacteria bacterium]
MSNKENNEQLEIIRHSFSHVLAAAVKELYPDVKFAIGPAIDNGFYYDFDFGKDGIKEEDLKAIEKKMKHLIKQNLQFSNFDLQLNEALEKMKNEPYKQELINDLKKAGEKEVSFYKLGNFEDLCKGPHVEATNKLKADAFKLDRIAGAYWKGSEKNNMLTRIYGLAFESKKELEEYIKMREEMEARNHRKIGAEMGLFMISNEVGQGLPIWLPNGYASRRALEDYVLSLERRYGYKHILTPVINKKELFETSGHLSHYKEDMYAPIEIDDETYYLKPMSCPAGMMAYKHEPKSYRDLPLKIGELGNVYRYEKSGQLHGLQRVRGFTQNDAHIFCTDEQLTDQFLEVFELLDIFYKAVGFEKYTFRLSLSDEDSDKYVGKREDWIKAEDAMRKALKKAGYEFTEAKGEAAFYGPKVDIQAINVFGKEDSVSTVQVDFNLPERFDLTYIDKDGQEKRPFVIHRALIGSFERFFSFLIEYHAGKFPVWFAPVQVKLISVSEKHIEYVQKLAQEFRNAQIRTEVDINDETVGNKIRKATQEKVPYMLVIGDQEIDSDKLSVRERGSRDTVDLSKEELIDKIKRSV